MNIKKHGAILPFSWEQLAGPRRGGRMVVTPRSRFWLLRRRVFVWLWERVESHGLRHKFLDYGMCYECGGAVEATTSVEDREWVFAE